MLCNMQQSQQNIVVKSRNLHASTEVSTFLYVGISMTNSAVKWREFL